MRVSNLLPYTMMPLRAMHVWCAVCWCPAHSPSCRGSGERMFTGSTRATSWSPGCHVSAGAVTIAAEEGKQDALKRLRATATATLGVCNKSALKMLEMAATRTTNVDGPKEVGAAAGDWWSCGCCGSGGGLAGVAAVCAVACGCCIVQGFPSNGSAPDGGATTPSDSAGSQPPAASLAPAALAATGARQATNGCSSHVAVICVH
jgi:hypothetical protein